MSTSHDIQAVIFDCDGTLVDSETLGALAMREVAMRYGLVMSEVDFLKMYKGRNMAMNIAEINSHLAQLAPQNAAALPEDFATLVRAAMAKKFDKQLSEIEGASALMQRVVKSGLPHCVATNGPLAKAEQTLGLTGLLPYFQGRIYSGYDLNTWKPAPDMFLHAAKQMGVAPAHCAVVEDSVSGITAGIAAGMQVFALMPTHEWEELPRATQNSITHIDALAQLPF